MRYRIQSYPMMVGHWVTISGLIDDDPDQRTVLAQFMVPYDELKVDDLLHLLEAIWREVGAFTP